MSNLLTNMKTILPYVAFSALLAFCFSCTKSNEKEKQRKISGSYFTGEITVSESRGLYGSLSKVHTTYTLSENHFKREQRLGGINSVFEVYAGVTIDLEKDTVILYYADRLSDKKNKHTTSIEEFKKNKKYKSFPNSSPSPLDHTFRLLPDYRLINQMEDSTEVNGFICDYTLYKDKTDILKQEVFDTKEIKVRRELLEMVFLDIPAEVNFPLKSDLRTTISDISNDSIVSGEQSRAIDLFIRDFFTKKDSLKREDKTDLEKIASNKWVKLGLNIVKKGIDLNINITSDLADLSSRKVAPTDFSLPDIDFTEISDIDDFMNELPSQEGGDFDD